MEIPLDRVLTSGCFSHSRSHIHMIATLDGKELLKLCSERQHLSGLNIFPAMLNDAP